VIGIFTEANRWRSQSPSAPTAYSFFRHQRRHCRITPLGISVIMPSFLPGKYPATGTTAGTRKYHKNQATRLVGAELYHQVPTPDPTVIMRSISGLCPIKPIIWPPTLWPIQM